MYQRQSIENNLATADKKTHKSALICSCLTLAGRQGRGGEAGYGGDSDGDGDGVGDGVDDGDGCREAGTRTRSGTAVLHTFQPFLTHAHIVPYPFPPPGQPGRKVFSLSLSLLFLSLFLSGVHACMANTDRQTEPPATRRGLRLSQKKIEE